VLNRAGPIVVALSPPPTGCRLGLGTKDLLDRICGPGASGRFRSPAMVGTGSNYSHLLLELVGGLSQRLVL